MPAKMRKRLKGPSLTDLCHECEARKVRAGALELGVRKGELIECKVLKRFIAERARMERESWLAWASAAAAPYPFLLASIITSCSPRSKTRRAASCSI